MGMYTEFHFNAELIEGVPSDVVALLKLMTDDASDARVSPPRVVPAHEFFTLIGWQWLLKMHSAYFDMYPCSMLIHEFERYSLSARSNLKNYCNEIEQFVDWITPYLDKRRGEFLGFSRYEEEEIPTLLFHPNQWIKPSIPEIESELS